MNITKALLKHPEAEVAVTRRLFAAILDRIESLALPPPVVDGAET